MSAVENKAVNCDIIVKIVFESCQVSPGLGSSLELGEQTPRLRCLVNNERNSETVAWLLYLCILIVDRSQSAVDARVLPE